MGYLKFREVEIGRISEEGILVTQGLAQDDMVVISSLKAPTDGMTIRVPDLDAQSTANVNPKDLSAGSAQS